jgi:hypothetical protein
MQVLSDDMPEPATDPVADDRITDLAADGEADPGGFVDVIPELQVKNEIRPSGTIAAPNGRGELFSPPHPVSGRQHSRRCSDRDLRAALAAARRQDRPPRTGAHTKPEAVLLVPAAVVRLVRALAHSRLQWGAAVNVLMSHRAP